jgi:hypothetical protein
MPRPQRLVVILAAVLVVAAVRAMGAEPLFTLSEGGRTFLYRARPGDRPSQVAEMFGLPESELQTFLAANGITDPTRVGTGFVYRIPNLAARELADRVAALEGERERLAHEAGDTSARARALTREAGEARAGAALAEARAEKLARAEHLWPLAQALAVVLAIVAAGATAVAVAATRRQRQAVRFARALSVELEDKRKTGMAERQESARRILDLETRIRTLESQLGPRVLIGGRNS